MMFLVTDCKNAPSEHIIIITLKFNQPRFSTKADWFSKLLQGISEGPTVYKYKN